MKKFVAFVVLLAANVAVGQMQTHSETETNNTSFVNHIVTCGSNNCWHQSAAAAEVFTKIRTSNGVTLAIDGADYGYQYSEFPTNQWVKHPEWGAVYDLQYDSQGNIWALIGNCGSGYSLGEWNGSTFVTQGVCYQQFTVSQDSSGLILGVDINGTLWTNNNTGNWQHFGQVGNGCPANTVAIADSSLFYVTCSDTGNIWQWSSGTWTQLSGTAVVFGHTTNDIAVSMDGDLYVIGGGMNVYHYNGSGWDRLFGSNFTSIAVDSDDVSSVRAVGPTVSNNNVYQFMEMTLRYTATFQQTAACMGCQHDNWVLAGWKGASVGNGRYEVTWNPPANNPGSKTVQSYSDLLDMESCLENDPGCTPTRDDYSHCTVAAVLVNDEPPQVSSLITRAATRMQRVPGSSGQPLGKHYAYSTVPYCSNTNTPMWSPQCILASHAADIAIDTNGYCITDVPGLCFYKYVQLGSCVGLGTARVTREHGPLLAPPYDGDPGPWANCTPQ